VAGVLTGRLERSARVRLPGGELAIDWADDGHVLLTGPAVEVFRGEWPDERIPRLRAA
jgi:diaminopimelate epimerase